MKSTIRLVYFIGALLLSASNMLEAQKPNIIIIFTDDQSFNSIGYEGGDVYTPCIDSLAKEGIRFSNAHVPSTVCSPSRYSLLTGRYSGRCTGEDFLNAHPEGTLARIENKVELRRGEEHLGSILQENGYKTGFVGKNHIMEHDLLYTANWESYGLQTYAQDADPYDPAVNAKMKHNQDVIQELVRSYGFDYADAIYMGNVKELHNDALNVHNLEWTVDKALTFIEQEKDNPFFLYFSTTLHHGPVPWGKKDGEYWSSFHADPKITGEGYVDRTWDFMPGRMEILDKVVQAGYAENSAYATLLDEGVRAIYKKVANLGIEDNTIIIYMSDHGSWRHGKATMHDYGTKVPMFMYWKNSIASGINYRDLIQSPDIAPTLLDIANIEYKGDTLFDGKSFKHILETGSGAGHESLYAELGYARSVKTRKWKYIANRYPENVQQKLDRGETFNGYEGRILDIPYLTQNGHLGYYASRVNPHYFERDQLYDLEADSAETINICNEYPEVVGDMQALLSTYLKDFENRPFGEFTRDDNSAPHRAILPLPRSTSIDVDFENLAIEWTSEAATSSHDVYFGINSSPSFIGNQPESNYSPSNLQENTKYYWRIDEVNEYGKTVGDTWSFNTASLIGMQNNIQDENLTYLYPNPATNNVTISLGNFHDSIVSVSLYNTNGQLLRSDSYENENEIILNVSDLKKGTYLLYCNSDNNKEIIKLII